MIGIEPNKEMRQAGEAYLAEFDQFTSVNGTAEATTLPDDSVDFVTAGQAAHWFDREKSLPELQRILRPGGFVVLVWNTMNFDATPFMQGYGQLYQRYLSNKPERNDELRGHVVAYLGEETQMRLFPRKWSYDLAGLTGGLLSSSYAPLAGDPRHEPMLTELGDLFAANEVNGRIQVLYTTELYFRQF